MYLFVLTNDSLYGLSWRDEVDLKVISDPFHHPFDKPLLASISDHQQLANTIGGSLANITDHIDFSGETIHILLDESLVFEEIITLRDDLEDSELQQYFEQKKQWYLGDLAPHYTFSWIENSDVKREYIVTFIPGGLPDALKLSLRELGAKPGKLLTPGVIAFRPGSAPVRHTVFESVRGYTVYGYTVRGNFITDLKFLSGQPKFSNWTGDPSIQDHIFSDEMAEIDAQVVFVGSFTNNQKRHWVESCFYTEIEFTPAEHPEPSQLTPENMILCRWVMDHVSQALPNLYETNRLYYPSETEPQVEKPTTPARPPEVTTDSAPESGSRFHGYIVALFLLTSVYYIASNWGMLREWRYWGYAPPVVKEYGPVSLSDTAREWMHSSHTYLTLLIEIMTNPQLQNYNKVIISSDALELLYPDTAQAPEILNEIYDNVTSTGITSSGKQTPVSPQEWRARFLKLFPDGTINVYRMIVNQDIRYVPVTVKLRGEKSIIGCLRWLQQGAENVAVRKAELSRTDSGPAITLYVAVLTGT